MGDVSRARPRGAGPRAGLRRQLPRRAAPDCTRPAAHRARPRDLGQPAGTGLIDTSRVMAEHVPNDELRHVYSSAGIVLNDHWDDMREHGYISNRVYDALACGAPCSATTSRASPSASARPSPSTAPREELHELIERLLADPAGAPPPWGAGARDRARRAHLRPSRRRAARRRAGARARTAPRAPPAGGGGLSRCRRCAPA